MVGGPAIGQRDGHTSQGTSLKHPIACTRLSHGVQGYCLSTWMSSVWAGLFVDGFIFGQSIIIILLASERVMGGWMWMLRM